MANWAIVVGINDYAGLPQQPLFGAVADAVDFAKWVTDLGGGAVDDANFFMWTFPPPAAAPGLPQGMMSRSAVWPLPATPDGARAPTAGDIVAVVSHIQNSVAAANGDQKIFVFFAGHGVQATKGPPETCFIVGDYNAFGGSVGLVPCEELKRSLESNGFREVFLFLDCCRTPMDLKSKVPSHFSDGISNGEYNVVGMAAQRRQRAYEYPKGNPSRGAFTKALVEGLRRIRDANHDLNLDALKDYVQARVKRILEQDSLSQLPRFDSEPSPRETPIHQGPPLETAAPILVATNIPNAHVRLLDNNVQLVDVVQSDPQGVARFDAAIGNLYAVEIVGGPAVDPFRHEGPGETHVP